MEQNKALIIYNKYSQVKLLKKIAEKASEFNSVKKLHDELNKSIETIKSQYIKRIQKRQNDLEELNFEILAYIKLEDLGISPEEINKIKQDLRDQFAKDLSEKKVSGDNFSYTEADVDENMLMGIRKKKKKNIIKLFKKLVKIFHPDLVKESSAKKQREKIMKSINSAYKNNDLSTLIEIDKKGTSVIHPSDVHELSMKLEQIESNIMLFHGKVRELRKSKFFKWKLKVDKSKLSYLKYFQEMETKLKIKTRNLEKKLNKLKNKEKGNVIRIDDALMYKEALSLKK